MTKTFTTSRFAPLELARPLETFGRSFSVEISSGLALSPSTILRAATGLTVQTMIRRHGLDAVFKQLQYSAAGKHVPSRTTRRNIVDSLGLARSRFDNLRSSEVSDDAQRADSMAFLAQLDDALDERLGRPSAVSGEWALLAAGIGLLADSNPLHVLVRESAKLDALGAEAAALLRQGKSEEAEARVDHLLKGVAGAWEALVPGLAKHRSVLLDSTLRILCRLERTFTGDHEAPRPNDAAVLALLHPSKKPLGHWFEELRHAVKCRDILALEKYLSRTVLIRGRPISYDRLKVWASVQPKNVMPFDAMMAVVEAVPDASMRGYLQSRFLLARGLTFLADFLRSSPAGGAPAWQGAQTALARRYSQLFCET